MKFTLDSSSLESFNKNRMVEIAGLYDDAALELMNHEIDRFLAKEEAQTQEKAMLCGHDLFRKLEKYKKTLQLHSLGQIAYELVAVKPLRLAFDQLLVAPNGIADEFLDTIFLKKEGSLKERSCVNELVMGALIALKAEEALLPFAAKAGHIVFFSPDITIPFDWLKKRKGDRYLLLAFSTKHAQYIFNEGDPQNHYLKRMGYVYGDKLKDSLNPIFYR